MESAVGKNRQEWITLAKDFQDFLSLVFMKPVSIEYIGFGDTNSPLLVQPFFWQHVKPDEVKLEKSGGITFDFARLKSSLDDNLSNFLSSDERTKRLYKSLLPVLQKTDEDILTNLGRILPAIDSFQDGLKYNSNGKKIKDFGKRVGSFINELPSELLSKCNVDEKWNGVEGLAGALTKTRNAISNGWELPTHFSELNNQLWMIIQIVWLRLFSIWGVQPEVLASLVSYQANLIN